MFNFASPGLWTCRRWAFSSGPKARWPARLIASTNRKAPTGGWMSLTNMRRSLRAALPADLTWMTPTRCGGRWPLWSAMPVGRRRPSSSCLTRSRRPPRPTIYRGRPVGLMCGLCWTNTQAAIVPTEVSGKYQISGVSPTFRLTATSTASGLCAPEEIRTPNLLIRSQRRAVRGRLSPCLEPCRRSGNIGPDLRCRSGEVHRSATPSTEFCTATFG
jgi:hypothetical protein